MSANTERSPLSLVPDRPPGPGLTDFGLWLRSRGCGEQTITDRIEHVNDFTRSHPSFPNVTPMHVTAWLGRPDYAPWTRATYYGHLRSYFTFALENEFIDVDPLARMRRPKAPKGIPRPLTDEQVDQLLAGATNPNQRTWLILALYAGLRAHECAKLKGEDVTQESIFVLGKGGKAAEIPTHELVWQEALRRPLTGWWFPARSGPGHVRMQHVSESTGLLFKANGIPGRIHRCRHTYATRLIRAGVGIRTVQELMRHESLNSTMIYTEVNRAEKLDGISRLQSPGLRSPLQSPENKPLRTAATEARYARRAAKEARDATA